MLFEFLVHSGMIASKDTHAHHDDGNRILRWQKKFSRAGCRKEIVNVNRGKSIRISVAGSGVTALRKTTTERIESPHEDDRAVTISNIFMTFAWYGHLKYREVPLYKVILISWLIAFFEYCFQVPANRIGSYEFTAAQLKTIQEVITLTVFAAFPVLYLKQPLRWNYLAGFTLIVLAVAVIFRKW